MVIKRQAGFTLIEIMIAVMIVGLMAAVMGPKVMEFLGKGRKGAAKSQLAQIKDSLVTYNMDIGRFPTTREGLRALRENVGNNPKWQSSYLADASADPLDPWGNPYVYNSPPVTFKQYKKFELYSYGSDMGESEPQNHWIYDGE